MSDKQNNVLNKEEREQMENIIIRGQRIVFPERAEQWEKYVEDTFLGEYKGKDAEEALVIIDALNRGVSMENAKKMLTDIEPNGKANGPIRRAVLLFANRGPEFWKDTSEGHISLITKLQLFRIKRQNDKLTKKYQYTLGAGSEPEREENQDKNTDTSDELSKSWVLGDDEMQIINEKQNEIARNANRENQTEKDDKTDEAPEI